MSDMNEVLSQIDERDPEVEEFAAKFKAIYENQFVTYLKNLNKSEPLNATSLPTKKYDKNTYEQDSMNSTTLTFYFSHVENDENGNIVAIVATSFDKSENCHFTPQLCKDYGPYFNTTMFCTFYNVGRKKAEESEAEDFFLDLPIDLYNLIDE